MLAEERSVGDEVERLERLIAMVGNNIDSVPAFTFVEEQALTQTWPPVRQRSVLALDSVVYGFSFDPMTDTLPRICVACVPDTSAIEGTDVWAFAVQHALRRDVDRLGQLAKAEATANDQIVQPSWQYKVIDYDRSRHRTIELIFLHETVMLVK